tara:strand:- start:1882 stop:2475 length:594 start_codon:yes stop_codon:yes gene_type:complete
MASIFDLPPDERPIDMVFSGYRDAIAWQLMDFLYGDQRANPARFNEPETWGDIPAKVITHTLTFDTLSYLGPGQTERMDLGGGENIIVLGMTATARAVTAQANPRLTELNNERLAYITYQQARNPDIHTAAVLEGGTDEVPATPLSNVAGTGVWPASLQFPWCWYGTSSRYVRLRNNGDANQDVFVTYQIVTLDTGR